MVEVSDDDFRSMVTDAIDSLPERYLSNMKNVGFVVESEPSKLQRQKVNLGEFQTLFGLYEGVPLTQRGAGYGLTLPDKITIFKNPHCAVASSKEDLKKRIYHTVWHEVAHHFGLAHSRIYDLEARRRASEAS